MYTGKSYRFPQFLFWTRRSVYVLVVIATAAVALHEVAGLRWLAIPWNPVLLLGALAALTVGFKIAKAYGRTWEAQQAWSSIACKSRVWGEMSTALLGNADESRKFVYRHLAWLAALRYALREGRVWETRDRKHNKEYERFYAIPEKAEPLEVELLKYLPREEVAPILVATNRAARVLTLQQRALRDCLDADLLSMGAFVEMQRVIGSLHEQQRRSEVVKNVPYPRQYATVNKLFVWILCLVLPFAMIGEFEQMNGAMGGFVSTAWLSIPMSVLVSWMFVALDQVGENTSNPFEGGANDIPITQICEEVELELKEMLGETGLPMLHAPENEIVM